MQTDRQGSWQMGFETMFFSTNDKNTNLLPYPEINMGNLQTFVGLK